jgi:hypothetical protein
MFEFKSLHSLDDFFFFTLSPCPTGLVFILKLNIVYHFNEKNSIVYYIEFFETSFVTSHIGNDEVYLEFYEMKNSNNVCPWGFRYRGFNGDMGEFPLLLNNFKSQFRLLVY